MYGELSISRATSAKPYRNDINKTISVNLRLLQISQFVILNRVKDLFLVLQKQILHSVQDDGITENKLLQEAHL
jgi:hypothetical protein